MYTISHLYGNWSVHGHGIWLWNPDWNGDRPVSNCNRKFAVSQATTEEAIIIATVPASQTQAQQATFLDRLFVAGERRGDQHQTYLKREITEP